MVANSVLSLEDAGALTGVLDGGRWKTAPKEGTFQNLLLSSGTASQTRFERKLPSPGFSANPTPAHRRPQCALLLSWSP